MTVCVDIRVVVPGAWVTFSYSSAHAPRPELGLEGDDNALYGWLLGVRHRFPIRLSPTHWHRVCLRRDVLSNSFSLEVGGQVVAERTVIAQAIPPSGSLWLGCRPRDRPPGAVIGEVEVYMFRMWDDLFDHGPCEDGTVIGWNADFWGVTSPQARQRDPDLQCASTSGFARLLSPPPMPSSTTTSSPVVTPVTYRNQTTVTVSVSSTSTYTIQTEPPPVRPSSVETYLTTIQDSSITPSSVETSLTTSRPLHLTTPSSVTAAEWEPSTTTALPLTVAPGAGKKTSSSPVSPVTGGHTEPTPPRVTTTTPPSNVSSANHISATSQTSPITTWPANQTTSVRTDTLGSALVNCDISQLCSNEDAYFLMAINVDAKGNGKSERDVHNWVSRALSCSGVSDAAYAEFCERNRRLQVMEVNCGAKTNIRETTCNVLLKLRRAVSACGLRHAGVSALQRAGDEQIQARIIGKVERVGRDLCEDMEPSSGKYMKCTSSSPLEDICEGKQHSSVSCSLIQLNSFPAPQLKTGSCSGEEPRLCDCTAFCESERQFFAIRINITSAAVNVIILQKLLSRLPCNTLSECQEYLDISQRYQGVQLECQGTHQRLYSCMVILEMSGPVNGCSLSKLLQRLIGSYEGIISETQLSQMVVCGRPDLPVQTLLASNLTWSARDLQVSDICQPASTLLKCHANETLAVLLTDSCPPQPPTPTPSAHPSTLNIPIGTEAPTPTAANTTRHTPSGSTSSRTTTVPHYTESISQNTAHSNSTADTSTPTPHHPSSDKTEYNVTSSEVSVSTSHKTEYITTTEAPTSAHGKTEYNLTTEVSTDTPVPSALQFNTTMSSFLASPSYTTVQNGTTATNNSTTAANNYTVVDNVSTGNWNNSTSNATVSTSTTPQNYTTVNKVTTALGNFTTTATVSQNNTTASQNVTPSSTMQTQPNTTLPHRNTTPVPETLYDATASVTNLSVGNVSSVADNTAKITATPLSNQTRVHTTPPHNTSTTAVTAFSPVSNTTAGTSGNPSSTASGLTDDLSPTTKTPRDNLTTTASSEQQPTTATAAEPSPHPGQIKSTTAKVSVQSSTLTSTTSRAPGAGSTSTSNSEKSKTQLTLEEQVDEILEQTQEASQLNSSQVVQLVGQLEKILEGPTISQTMGQKAINIVSNLMESDPLALSAAANRLIRVVDDLGLKLLVPGEVEILSSDSLVLGVQRVNGTNFKTTSVNIQDTNNVEIHTSTRFFTGKSSTAMCYLYLPSSITGGLSPDEQRQASRIQFNLYTKSILFQDTRLNNQTIVSPVLASSVTNMSISNLTENIKFTIHHTNPLHTSFEALCAFWDFAHHEGAGGWNASGCSVVSTTAEDTTCSCNHLTSFAILLDLSRGKLDQQQAQILTFITYIGCGVSALFLAITLLTYLSFEKLLRDIPAKILVQLCTSLLLLNLVFLINGWLALFLATGLCISTAFFLHYFLLTSFTWAGLEALHMYLSIIQVFTPYLSRYMLKFSLMGWGIPLIVVIIVIAADKDNYGLVTYGKFTDGTTDDFCWLRNDIAFYVGVVAYFLLIFVLCLLVFIVVMVQLHRIKKQNPQNQSPNRGVMTDLRSIAGLTVLLGLTWGFALFAWGPLYLPFIYLFSIFNSLQGFFVFVFHCAFKENVRRQWRTYLCCGRLRLAENSDWSRTATHNKRNLSVAASASALHLTSRSSSVISDSTNSSGSVFADSGISDISNSDVVLNEIYRGNVSAQVQP
ncbi:uncharacterized protein adgrg2a [Aulostomus maculatus]